MSREDRFGLGVALFGAFALGALVGRLAWGSW